MALVTTILGVVAVLSAAALLLWLSTLIEAKQLGPREPASVSAEPAPAAPVASPDPVGAERLGTAA